MSYSRRREQQQHPSQARDHHHHGLLQPLVGSSPPGGLAAQMEQFAQRQAQRAAQSGISPGGARMAGAGGGRFPAARGPGARPIGGSSSAAAAAAAAAQPGAGRQRDK